MEAHSVLLKALNAKVGLPSDLIKFIMSYKEHPIERWARHNFEPIIDYFSDSWECLGEEMSVTNFLEYAKRGYFICTDREEHQDRLECVLEDLKHSFECSIHEQYYYLETRRKYKRVVDIIWGCAYVMGNPERYFTVNEFVNSEAVYEDFLKETEYL